MTISSTTNRVSYTGNGVTTEFAFAYKFLVNTDLKVYNDGALQTITTDYTVTGAGEESGGTVTFGTAFANANYSVSIMSTANRTWIVSSVAAGSFVINSNSNTALTGNNVYWTAIKHGEYP